MKVLSTIISAAVLANIAFLPVLAETDTYSSTTTTTTTQPAVMAPGDRSVITNPAMLSDTCAPAICAPTTCAPTVITQPAVVSRVCENRNYMYAGLGVLALAGIATAIAVPIAVHHHHHHNRNQQAAIQQQQLLIFANQNAINNGGVPLFNPFLPLVAVR